ncbi:MFS transporter [Bacillus sp. MUM 13]|uniref:MFS transporter n=1 Tax=Bacillus sp. MUM 13 TaxID=1678001 RepID=UPI0008F5F230|nr:MFS transporter [Bacillus sp. MUM 13]OIK12169.1 MFS transporter [Bacillus sp. MUM 13]
MFKFTVKRFASYNRNIRMLLLGNIFMQSGFGIFMVIYNFYIRELGFSDNVNGQVISYGSLATALLLIPAGLLGDKIGRRKLLISGVAATGFFMLLRSLLHSEVSLLAMAFLAGGATAFFQVLIIPLLAENSSVRERVQIFSLHFAVMTAANVAGSLLGGALTDILKLFISDLYAIRISLLSGGIMFLCSIVPFLAIAKEEPKPIESHESDPAGFDRKSLKVIILFFISQLLIGTGSGLVIPYLNLYFADRFFVSNSMIAIILSAGQGATAAAMLIGPRFVKRFGEVKSVVILQMLSLPFLLLTAYTHQLWIAAIAFLFRQALMNAGNPIQMSLMMSLVSNRSKGLANSMNQMAFNLGWAFMGPVSASLVISLGSYWGYAAVFSITAGIYLLATTFFFIVFKSLSSRPSFKEGVSKKPVSG